MQATKPNSQPVVLMLDRKSDVKLNESSFLPWWIQNTSDAVLGEVRVHATVMGGDGVGFEIRSASSDSPWPDGEARRLSTAFKASAAGKYALRVQVTVCHQDEAPVVWECPDEITVGVENPDALGRVNLHINESSVIKGDLPPGDIHINSASLLKFEPKHAPEPPRFATLGELPPEAERLFLRLVPAATPGLGSTIDLAEFSKHWKSTRRPGLDRFEFIDDLERTVDAPVRVGAPYRLRLKSHRGGCITLISQGSSNRFFQLVPHVHYGKQVAAPNATVLLTDMVENYAIRVDGQGPDPAKRAARHTCSGCGRERALALVSPQPLRPEVDVFQGSTRPPPTLDAAQVRDLLQRALEMPDIELGYHAMDVRD